MSLKGNSIDALGHVYSGDSTVSDHGINISGNVRGPVTIRQGAEKRKTPIPHQFGVVDPRVVRTAIEHTKDKLIEGSCSWVLEDSAFRQWWNNDDDHLLWIQGGPGKGKTMMMTALITEISKLVGEKPGSGVVSYFFCQNTDSRLNSAVAVLRGLIFHLVAQDDNLRDLLREKHDESGGRLFEDSNALYALSNISADLCQRSSCSKVIYMIDALDECDLDLPSLLKVVSQKKDKVKWLVTSRPERIIREEWSSLKLLVISLDANSEYISKSVELFIESKVNDLTNRKGYNNQLQASVAQYLSKKAENTFLWVALVCKELEDVQSWDTEEKLQTFPPSLNSLYERILTQILCKQDKNTKICRQILCLVTLAVRPLCLEDIMHIGAILDGLKLSYDAKLSRKLVELCGSFITIQKETVSFVHQSASDFFKTGKGSSIFKDEYSECCRRNYSTYNQTNSLNEDPTIWQACAHSRFTERSIVLMSTSLKENICKLSAWDVSPRDVPQDQLIENIPSHIRYTCQYWVDHLYQASNCHHLRIGFVDNGTIYQFLKEHFLHWLECLSLTDSMTKGIRAVKILESILLKKQHNTSNFLIMMQDAHRFILYHRYIIENAPLQVYTSALVFSPTQSRIRIVFKNNEPSWIKTGPRMEKNWSLCLQTLQGHRGPVLSVVFSRDGQRLASCSGDRTVRVWDAHTGAPLQTLQGHTDSVNSVVFSRDGQRLASCSWDSTVRVWDAHTGAPLQTLQGHTSWVNSVVSFSSDNRHLVTNVGSILLDQSSLLKQSPNFLGYHLHGSWICWNNSKILWLPLDCRPTCSMVTNQTIAIGNISGRVLIIVMDSTSSPSTTT